MRTTSASSFRNFGQPLRRIVAGLCLAGLMSTAWAAGEVSFVAGEVSALNAKGESRVLRKGDRIEQGDTIVTGSKGEAHLTMDDRALVALRPGTRLVIDEYRAQGDAEDRAGYRLLGGFMRSVTGWIGKIAPDRYRVRTQVATIGIRGTDHEVGVIIDGPDAGTYDKVNEGGTRLSNAAGGVEIERGRAGFVAQGRPAAPRVLERVPAVFKPTANEQRIEERKRELARDVDERLRARRTNSASADCGPDGAAMTALRDFIAAYEAGDLARVQGKLNPAMPGYQRFIDQLAREFTTQKQIRIFVKDVQFQCGPDLANLVLTWEKRFLDATTFQPGFYSGHVSILMQRGKSGWSPGAFAGDSPFARATGSAARFNFGPAFALNSVTPQPTTVPVTLEVLDADLTGQGNLAVQVVTSSGDNESIMLSEISPGRFMRSTLMVSSQAPTPGNGVLEVASGVTLSARYIDQQPGNHQPPASLVRSLTPTGQLPIITDIIPDSFSFPPLSQVTGGSVVTSVPQTITGINAPSPVSVTGGLVSIQNGPFVSAGNISNGQTIAVRVTAAAAAGGTSSATVNIGGVTANFVVTTATLVPDTVPDPFVFNQAFGAVGGSQVSSAAVVISGINSATPVSVVGGEVSIGGGAFTTSGSINNGQTLQARGFASVTPGGTASVQVSVGGVLGIFTINTQPAGPDTTPDPFTWIPATNITPTASATSNAVTITGIDSPTPVSSATALVSINGGAFASSGTVNNGQTVTVRGTAPATFGQTTLHQVSIGGVMGSFAVSTPAADTTPNAFAFTPRTQALPSTAFTSNTVTITGINVATPISVTGGTMSIAGGPFSAAPGTITNGQALALQGTSSPVTDGSGVLNVTVTVGTVSSSFTITTRDTTPDAFGFTTLVIPNSVCSSPTAGQVTSASITITGIDAPAPVTVSAPASYSIGGGAFVSSGGSIAAGQTLQIRTARPAPLTSATTTINIGQNGSNPGTNATWTLICSPTG